MRGNHVGCVVVSIPFIFAVFRSVFLSFPLLHVTTRDYVVYNPAYVPQ